MSSEAGLSPVSVLSIVAGTVAAYGTFAIVAAIVGAVLVRSDATVDFSTNQWTSTAALGGLATAVVLLVAYLFGGYIAGRMAGRAGLLHGAAVALVSLIAGALVGGIVSAVSDRADLQRNLGSIGVPTSLDRWNALSWTTAVIGLAAIIVGAVLGGLLGVRWHTRLVRRIADPDVGASHVARERAAALDAERVRYTAAATTPRGGVDTTPPRADVPSGDERDPIDLRDPHADTSDRRVDDDRRVAPTDSHTDEPTAGPRTF